MNITEIVAGDSYQWTEGDVLSGYDLKLTIRNAENRYDFTAASITDVTTGVNRYQFSLSSTDTAAMSSGDYLAVLVLIGDQERRTLVQSTIMVKPDPLGSASFDSRSWVKRVLDDIEAVLENRANDAVFDRTVDGVTLRYMSTTQLLEARQKFAAMYAQEQAGGIIDLPGEVNLSFRGAR